MMLAGVLLLDVLLCFALVFLLMPLLGDSNQRWQR